MSFSSLRDFIRMLEAKGRLVRVTEPVSPVLEVTEIQTRLLAEGGPAVLFENVVGANGERYDMPLLANLFGTVERVAWGLNREPSQLREIGDMLAFLKQPQPPARFRDSLEMLPLIKQALTMKPKTVSSAPCQEVVLKGDRIDLARLPIQTCWPGEPAPLITWPLIVTKGPSADGPDADRRDAFNLGIYRMQVTGRNTTYMRWLKHRGGAQHHARWKQSHKDPLPAAAVIGADPGTILAAVTPVPDTLSEYQFAGLLRGKKVELVDCKTVPLKVPAQAEIVIEGTVSLDDYGDEGPYGDHTGYYNAVEPFPVFTVSAITMRRDPIYLSTFTGRPPDEPSVSGRGPERGLRASAHPAVPGDRGLLAAAGGLLLPRRGGVHEQAVPRSREADHDGGVVVPPPVHVHEIRHRRGRGYQSAGLERRHLGGIHQRRRGAGYDAHREHAHRLSRLRVPRIGPGQQDGNRRDGENTAGDPSAVGTPDSHDRCRHRGRDAQMATLRPSRIRKAHLEVMAVAQY